MNNVKRNAENKKDLAEIKHELLERKAQLEEQLNRLYTEKIADTQTGDVGDQALSASMESLRDSLQDSENLEYNRIVKALNMIEDGSYGVCIDCGNPIAEKRLKSYPNATRCISCQEAFESRS